MRRVFPPPAEAVSIAEAYAVERPAPAGRPWVGVCMVASLDGSSVVDGRSGALGNANDTTVLATLRQLADVVIVGAGTVRAEGYGAPKKPGLRIGVVTNTGAVDVSSRLFTSGAGFFVVPEGVDTPEGVDVVRAGHGRVDLPLALERLEQIVAGVRYVQAEGGPRLNGSLAEHDLIDELDLTISPRVVGGAGSRVVAGATDLDARFELVHEQVGELDLTISPRVVGGAGSRVVAGATDLDARFELAHLLVDDESFVFSRWVRRRAC